MHLLLPPSEGKTDGGRGRPLRGRLGDSRLDRARSEAVDALLRLVAGPREPAAAALLLPAGVVDTALAANAAVLDARTTPALRRYSGVVYDGFAVATMSAAEQRVAARTSLVFSGLFGVVRGNEAIPTYRVPAKAVLPGLGIAATYWRPVLADVLPAMLGRGLVVDLRSGDYASMWRPGPALADRVVSVRVLSPAPRGGHAVISYNSKFAKGLLAAALVRRVAAGEAVISAEQVMHAWTTCGRDAVIREHGSLDLYTG